MDIDEEAVKKLEEMKRRGWREVRKQIRGEKYLYLRYKVDGKTKDVNMGMLPPEEIDMEL